VQIPARGVRLNGVLDERIATTGRRGTGVYGNSRPLGGGAQADLPGGHGPGGGSVAVLGWRWQLAAGV